MKVTLNSIAQEDAGALMCCFDAERTADGLSHGIAAADGIQRSKNSGRVSFVIRDDVGTILRAQAHTAK